VAKPKWDFRKYQLKDDAISSQWIKWKGKDVQTKPNFKAKPNLGTNVKTRTYLVEVKTSGEKLDVKSHLEGKQGKNRIAKSEPEATETEIDHENQLN
jgi:hypothetical protein